MPGVEDSNGTRIPPPAKPNLPTTQYIVLRWTLFPRCPTSTIARGPEEADDLQRFQERGN